MLSNWAHLVIKNYSMKKYRKNTTCCLLLSSYKVNVNVCKSVQALLHHVMWVFKMTENPQGWIWLCRYRKRTDIYYWTCSLENVAKICHFQVLDPPKHTLAIFGGYKKFYTPKKLLVNISWNLPVSVYRPPPKHTLTILGVQKIFLLTNNFIPPKNF